MSDLRDRRERARQQLYLQRIAREEDLLRRRFPSFTFKNRKDVPNMAVVGHVLSNSKRKYTLFVSLTEFPEQVPTVFVMSPMMRTHDHRKLSSIGASVEFHTLEPSGFGHVQICHYNDHCWRPSITLYEVVMKCRLWIEAYEAYLRTGDPIDQFLGHM